MSSSCKSPCRKSLTYFFITFGLEYLLNIKKLIPKAIGLLPIFEIKGMATAAQVSSVFETYTKALEEDCRRLKCISNIKQVIAAGGEGEKSLESIKGYRECGKGRERIIG